MPRAMHYALSVPNFRSYGDPHRLVALAREAEAAGWDGFFLWDHLWRSLGLEPGQDTVDPWVALGAVATATGRIMIGTMVTPVARRRPWKLAREILTLDHLSHGRVIFGAGLGDPPEHEFEAFGEDGDAIVRARKLDEGLTIVRGLLSGDAFSFAGEHYELRRMRFGPAPVRGHVPIWIAGRWPARPPFRRAARFDGAFPIAGSDGQLLTPRELRSVCAFVEEQREETTPFDYAVLGLTQAPDDTATVAAMGARGATWWVELLHDDLRPWDATLARVRQGPPRVQPGS